uniref:Uncharacterized protein n=1 Tax=Aegilops tauschii TaxID=37682 RepID=M8BM02_AEGTA
MAKRAGGVNSDSIRASRAVSAVGTGFPKSEPQPGGRERDDGDHLHMAGVQDKDKVLLLEDPAVTQRKLRSTSLAQLMGVPCHSFIQV